MGRIGKHAKAPRKRFDREAENEAKQIEAEKHLKFWKRIGWLLFDAKSRWEKGQKKRA